MPFSNTSHRQDSYLSDPDVLLMLEFQKGNKSSFEKLMERHYKRVFNLTYRFVGNTQIAEDLTQEVFINIYKSVSTYQPQAKFQTWLYQIAKNVSLNELRKHKAKTVSLDETFKSEDNEFKREIADTKAATPSQELLEKETAQVIKEAINSLPENQRLAVILRRYENFSYEEIAKMLNCSVKAVKSLLHRAKESLKAKLKGFIETYDVPSS